MVIDGKIVKYVPMAPTGFILVQYSKDSEEECITALCYDLINELNMVNDSKEELRNRMWIELKQRGYSIARLEKPDRIEVDKDFYYR